jgi:hypothetical protein
MAQPKWYSRLITLLVSLALSVAYSSCLFSKDEESPVEGEFSYFKSGEILKIETPQNAKPGIIVSNLSYSYCSEGEIRSDSAADTMRYVISEGDLYLWKGSDCTSMKLSGPSGSIIGKWSGRLPDLFDTIPDSSWAESCEGGVNPEIFPNAFDKYSVKYTVSSSRIRSEFSGIVCYARAVAEILMITDSTIAFASSGCSSVLLRRIGKEPVASMVSHLEKGVERITFSFEGNQCFVALPFNLVDDIPECPSAAESSMEVFRTCIAESGF